MENKLFKKQINLESCFEAILNLLEEKKIFLPISTDENTLKMVSQKIGLANADKPNIKKIRNVMKMPVSNLFSNFFKEGYITLYYLQKFKSRINELPTVSILSFALIF